MVGMLEMGRKRQEWKERLEGMDNERCTKRAFEGVVEGRQRRTLIMKAGTILDNIYRPNVL